jgi:hypothetical protein
MLLPNRSLIQQQATNVAAENISKMAFALIVIVSAFEQQVLVNARKCEG